LVDGDDEKIDDDDDDDGVNVRDGNASNDNSSGDISLEKTSVY
jgi:hypothetical protein